MLEGNAEKYIHVIQQLIIRKLLIFDYFVKCDIFYNDIYKVNRMFKINNDK